ncbi:hypothetical protein YWIDRAFT_01054 [Streptomyces sp. SceaMP-e96]|nr:hypothetical protein YWIDRAFT_01054 [Streptomyces sp. SceaMP-e96]
MDVPVIACGGDHGGERRVRVRVFLQQVHGDDGTALRGVLVLGPGQP